MSIYRNDPLADVQIIAPSLMRKATISKERRSSMNTNLNITKQLSIEKEYEPY